METTERIVEAYVRYVKGWATIPNVRCAGQNEIDLIAIDPVSLARYHIEVSISISQGFRKLTAKPFDREKVKERVHQASQRRTLGFFAERKFDAPTVLERLKKFGFGPGKYTRIIVTWGWDEGVAELAGEAGIQLWDFRDIIRDIAANIRGSREYFADDTLRTLNLFIHADDEARRGTMASPQPRATTEPTPIAGSTDGHFWVYENWPNDVATVHRASCSHCNDGHGVHAGTSTKNGEWLGPFATADEAFARAQRTGRRDIRRCGICSPIGDDREIGIDNASADGQALDPEQGGNSTGEKASWRD